MSNTHESIMAAIQTYSEENQKFTEKGVKASGTRARKALAELGKLVKARRKEIQETKNAEKNAAAQLILLEFKKPVHANVQAFFMTRTIFQRSACRVSGTTWSILYR